MAAAVMLLSAWCLQPQDCDGAYSSSGSKAAFGFLARDSGGQALFWRTGKVVASSALFTEAWALCITCGTAVDQEIEGLPMSQREWSFSWVNREKNRVAHWLASQSLARNFVYSPDCILPDMEILLAKDKPP